MRMGGTEENSLFLNFANYWVHGESLFTFVQSNEGHEFRVAPPSEHCEMADVIEGGTRLAKGYPNTPRIARAPSMGISDSLGGPIASGARRLGHRRCLSANESLSEHRKVASEAKKQATECRKRAHEKLATPSLQARPTTSPD